MKYIFAILCAVIFYSCKTQKAYFYKDSDYKDKWQYFNLQDTVHTTIISHLPATVYCGNMAFGSVSIVKTEANDTIRILNLCNMERYSPGQKVVFKPAEKPNFSVHFSQTTVQYENKDTLYEQPSAYDLKILKTAWGYAVE